MYEFYFIDMSRRISREPDKPTKEHCSSGGQMTITEAAVSTVEIQASPLKRKVM